VEKSRRMRWAVYIARMDKRRDAYTVLVGKSEVRSPLERQGINGRITLKWIIEKGDGVVGWIYLTQDKDRWRASVNSVMNFQGFSDYLTTC
jgi:hypothetical protein